MRWNGRGSSNTAIGNNAMGGSSFFPPTTGSSCYNIAIGPSALAFPFTGSRNISMGSNSLRCNRNGNRNIAMGTCALYWIGFSYTPTTTESSDNIAIGECSLHRVSVGCRNVAVGVNTLGCRLNSSFNIAIGYRAFFQSGSLDGLPTSHNIGIGSYANFASGTTGSVIIGRSATSTASNQFVVGSTGSIVGLVTTETCTSTKTWSVVINGVAQKILLA
jgi:hypothetical protein